MTEKNIMRCRHTILFIQSCYYRVDNLKLKELYSKVNESINYVILFHLQHFNNCVEKSTGI